MCLPKFVNAVINHRVHTYLDTLGDGMQGRTSHGRVRSGSIEILSKIWLFHAKNVPNCNLCCCAIFSIFNWILKRECMFTTFKYECKIGFPLAKRQAFSKAFSVVLKLLVLPLTSRSCCQLLCSFFNSTHLP